MKKKPNKAVKRRPHSAKRKAIAVPKMDRDQAFKLRLERFCDEFILDLNGKEAAIRAGYSERRAKVQASEFLARPDVQEMIEQRKLERSKRTEITADEILRNMHAIATCDAREFSEVVIDSCRYCYGKGNRYQRTPREMELHREEWEATITKAHKGESPERIAELLEEFDQEGGVGYDKTKPPVRGCPECFGRGVPDVLLKPSSQLSAQAAMAFGFGKKTDKSLEIRLRDQDMMLVKVADHLGMFKKRVEVNAGDGTDTAPVRAHIYIPAKVPPSDEPIG